MNALNLDCSICLLPLHSHYIAVHADQESNELKHIFHRACLEEWMERQASCPLCRKDIVSIELAETLKQRAESLIFKAIEGRIDDLEDILNLGFLKTTIKIEALCQAVSHSQFSAARSIIKHQEKKTYFRETVLSLASKYNLKDVIHLIHEFRRLTQLERENCLIEASRYGSLCVINQMFSLGTISEHAIGEACHNAIDHGYYDLIPQISEHGTIPFLARSSACVKLAKKDKFFLVNSLLSAGPILDVSKARVLAYAIFSKSTEFLNYHIAEAPLLISGFEEALSCALIEKNHNEVAIYIKEALIPTEILEHFLERLVDANEHEIMKDLLDQFTFSKLLLEDLKLRAQIGHHMIMYQVIQDAIKWRFFRIVRQVLSW